LKSLVENKSDLAGLLEQEPIIDLENDWIEKRKEIKDWINKHKNKIRNVQ